MSKLLVGQNGYKIYRGANGRFVSKQKAKILETKDKLFLVNGSNKNEINKIEKEFGKGKLRNVTEDDFKCKSVKLSEIR